MHEVENGNAVPSLFLSGDELINEQLLELLPVAVYVCDADGVIRYFNRLAAELWGRSPTIGDTDHRFCGSHKLYTLDGSPILHACTPMADVLRTGKPQRNREAIVERPDGTRIHAQVNIDPLRDEQGRLIGAVNVFQDVTEQRQAQKSLKDTEQRFVRFMQHLPGLAWIKDLHGRYVYANAAAARAFNVPTELLCGRTDEQLFPTETARQFRLHDEAALKGAAGVQTIETLLQDDGILHHSLVSKFPILDSDGEPAFIGGMAIDITDRKRVEERLTESEGRFRFLAEMVPSIIWTAAPDGTITFVNQRWYDYCGITPEENACRWHEHVLHPDDRDRCLEAWNRALRDGTPYEIEVRNRRHDGVYRWFMSRAIPLKDESGKVTCWFGVTTDVNDPLEMKDQLFHADQRKNQFLAMLAHELRNPLAPIRSGLDILAMERPDETVSLMQQQVEHLVRLVDDLLDVSRIMHGRIELRRGAVSLKAMVEQACNTVRQLFEQKKQRLDVALPSDDVWFEADGVRLIQVLENLLTNASKYTDHDGHVELHVECQHGMLAMRVKDNGIGMDSQFLPEVFDLFSQAECSIDRSQGGLGIGLTLVRNIVEMHGGNVHVHSDGLGRGSEFTARLPLIVASQPIPSDSSVSANESKQRILVVDDNVGATYLLSKLLGYLDFGDVETAHDGPSCLAKLRVFNPDILLLDIGLPEMDGYSVAREIRSDPRYDDVLLVALTGYGQEQDRQKSKEAGFDVHLVKPPSHEQLTGLLSHPKLKRGGERNRGAW